ncbi:MAG TPA: hypothetical protein VMV94_02470, partial [Phycisphaerae bacterium]|nr:hypothetical protein [Phycisphaerae bacterium]
GNVLSVVPLAQISAVQLFDQPNYTVAFSVQEALNNPSLVSAINWVFGDGSGYVAGPAGKTSISHKYAAIGSYQATAYVFQGTDLAATINGTVTVVENDTAPGTGTTPGPLPGTIVGPNPRDNATDVNVTTKLTWTSGTNATSHDVYLGKVETDVENATVASAVYEGTLTVASFDPGGLTADTQYFWRIDERNDSGVTKGSVLSFTTAKAPTAAKDFVPVDGVTSAPVTQVLQWTPGKNVTSHDVYFGKDATAVTNATKDTTDVFKGNQSAASYDPDDSAALIDGQLLAAITYYWRIDEVGLGGTLKGAVLHFKTADPPPAVTDPVPADAAVNVDVNSDLGWSAVPAITSFDVYLGTDTVAVANASHSSPEFKSNVTAKTYDPGTLLGGTVYYWRIDTLGPGGTSKGVVFSFTTATPPPQVAGPFTPADNATNVAYTTDLHWSVGAGGGVTTSFDVYFGTSETAVSTGDSSVFKGNLDVSVTVYDPNDLTPDTQYYWRIDAVGPGGKTTGPLLTFRVGALPGPVGTTPTPPNGSKARPLDQQLAWTAGAGAVQHDVYFGKDQAKVQSAGVADAEYKGRQAGTTFNPGTLDINTTYYWRIDEVSPGGQTKGPVWNFATVAGQATDPSPTDEQTGVDVNADLSWTAGPTATSHDVYFGTVLADVTNATPATAGIYQGNQTATTFDPGLLDAGTVYYWRIDEISASGTTKGTVWSFTTGAGQATDPNPTDGQDGVSLYPTLTWTSGLLATSQDIYFGTSFSAVSDATRSSTEFQANQVGTSYVVGPLTGVTIYYWRIDSVTADGTTKGEIWQFRTAPGKASSPTPADFATGVTLTTSMKWTAGAGAAYHNVFFSTIRADVQSGAPAAYQGQQAGTTYGHPLVAGTTYYWRIDELAADGVTVTQGDVWTFTTAP